MKPAVLYARRDSIYKSMGLDVWDEERDARGYEGDAPVIAHPPCRAWGRLRALAKPRPGERFLGIHAVTMVRCFGGVLEHPAGSLLWRLGGLPLPGQSDAIGGWTLAVKQFDWGHRAEKKTWLYIVGLKPVEVPPPRIDLGIPPCTCGQSSAKHAGRRRRKGDPRWRLEISKREREATPPAFAKWLVDLASRCRRPE